MAARGKPVRVPTSLKAQATVRPTSLDSGFQGLSSPRPDVLRQEDGVHVAGAAAVTGVPAPTESGAWREGAGQAYLWGEER